MNGTIQITLAKGPLPPPVHAPIQGAGAVLLFEGVVRPVEAGQPLLALEYEAYEPMTTQELRRLAEQMVQQHGLMALRVEHSIGQVAVGEVSFRLTVASAHRAEGLAATTEFIDRMKRDVPLWKVPQFAKAADKS